MKKGLKVLAMVIVAAMLLSMAAFAAEVTPGDITHEEVGDDYSIVVNYNASEYEDGDQVTLLVLTGSSEIEFADDGVTPTNVGYIDQEAIEGDEGSFTFAVAKEYVLNNEVYVKLGATAKTSVSEDTYTFDEDPGEDPGEDPVDPPVEVECTISTLDVSNAYGVEGLKIIKIEGTDGTKSLSVDGGSVIAVDKAGEIVFFVITAADITAEDLTWTEEAPEASLIGDADGNATLDIFDATAALTTAAVSGAGLSDVEKFLTDANTDGYIDIFDATGILSIVAGSLPPILQ